MNKTTTWIGPGPNSYSITLHWRTEGTRGAVVVALVTPMAKAFLADQQTIADLRAQNKQLVKGWVEENEIFTADVRRLQARIAELEETKIDLHEVIENQQAQIANLEMVVHDESADQTIAELRKALEALNKSSDAVWKEINEFDKPVSSEIYGWWEQAQLDARKALAAIATTEGK